VTCTINGTLKAIAREIQLYLRIRQSMKNIMHSNIKMSSHKHNESRNNENADFSSLIVSEVTFRTSLD